MEHLRGPGSQFWSLTPRNNTQMVLTQMWPKLLLPHVGPGQPLPPIQILDLL